MENKETFDELYNRLYNENFSKLDSIRREEEKKSMKDLIFYGGGFLGILAVIMIALVSAICAPNHLTTQQITHRIIFIVSIPIGIIFIGLIVSVLKASKKDKTEVKEKKVTYIDLFTERIVTPIIKSVFENSEYYCDDGLTEEEYDKGDWESYDRYSSEDKIITQINIDESKDLKTKLVMSQVHTEDRHKDDEGKVYYSTVFSGIAGYADLPKDIGCYLDVAVNGWFDSCKDKLEMDMSGFEEMFDVKTDDKIKAMQILTSDIMSELIQLTKTSNFRFEFYINHGRIYIRFHTGGIFETSVFSKTMNYEELKEYFDILSSIKNITEHICTVILNTDL